MAIPKQEQVEIAERLQLMVLQDFLKMAESGEMTAQDRKTLVDLLKHNGWTLDPTRMPQGLADKLTRRVDPTQLDKDDPDVVGRIAV